MEKVSSILKTQLSELCLELEKPRTELLPVVLAGIRAAPWLHLFLIHWSSCIDAFLSGQFPANSPLMGDYLPSLNLIRHRENFQISVSQSLIEQILLT